MSVDRPTVLQVIPALETGGAEKTTIDVALALKEQGWTALVASSGGRLTDVLADAGITHLPLPLTSKNPATIVANAFRLARYARRSGVSLFHARSRAPAWSVYLASRMTGIPFLTTQHGDHSQNNRLKRWYNSVMLKGLAVITPSVWMAETLKQRYPNLGKKVVPIFRGTDFSKFKPGNFSSLDRSEMRAIWGVADTDFVLLHLARMTRLKGQTTVIAAAGMLAKGHPSLKVVFAGDVAGRDSYLDELKKQIADLGLQDRVIFAGHCDDPARALFAADLAISASRQAETFGRVAVEAGAMERPVIVTDLGAVSETVLAPPQVAPSQRTGWKVAAENPSELVTAISEVLTMKKSERNALGVRARAHVTQNFGLSQMLDKTLKVYAECLNLDRQSG